MATLVTLIVMAIAAVALFIFGYRTSPRLGKARTAARPVARHKRRKAA